MPKLVLINPNAAPYKLAKRGFKVQPLNLAYVAALTPPSWDIFLDDENMAPAPLHPDADLVGITTLTTTANRAYELATAYRRLNIPVVLGGIHVSMVPEEGQRFATSVVVGESESVWPTVIEDFTHNRLQSRYDGERTDFKRSIRPRRDLLSPRYTIGSIQTSRGCPFDCEFCSVKAFNGPKFRQRDADDVLAELEEIPQKTVFFTDDNLIGYSSASRQRAKEIFRGMISRKMNKRWLCQTSINFADDPETLKLAEESGCAVILVGIESINEDVLRGTMHKEINSRRGSRYYYEFLDKVHRHGIAVIGNMVFGNDEDGPTIFEETARFFDRSGLDIPWPGLLTPYPGTRLAARLTQQNRLLYTNYPEDWAKFNTTLVVALRDQSHEVFFEKFRRFTRSSYTMSKILKRAFRTFCHSRSLQKSLLVFGANLSLSRRFRKGITAPPKTDALAQPTRRESGEDPDLASHQARSASSCMRS